MNGTDRTNQLLIYKIQKLRKRMSISTVQSNSLAIYDIAPSFLQASFVKELFDYTIMKTNAIANTNLAMLRDYQDILIIAYLQFVKQKKYGIAVRSFLLLYTISNNKRNIENLVTDLYSDDLISMEKMSDIPVSIIFKLLEMPPKEDLWQNRKNRKNPD
ncbi:hypothetical protein DLJ48_03665 [Oenococcus sicerae]|uniref:Uncharacterized protein n=1 Tax=Oenococcus sicerae TaxID=2203724 RepID=A0AAJ1R9P6_9LACO|nr:hypothetical protein [Oenococcus sicerae]MDN6900070.1 hypothetical protein [Oenococcus sicerae]QAS69678.1 hypothetical protein DLJ48_03665 [Oenococcus sicerae]